MTPAPSSSISYLSNGPVSTSSLSCSGDTQTFHSNLQSHLKSQRVCRGFKKLRPAAPFKTGPFSR